MAIVASTSLTSRAISVSDRRIFTFSLAFASTMMLDNFPLGCHAIIILIVSSLYAKVSSWSLRLSSDVLVNKNQEAVVLFKP